MNSALARKYALLRKQLREYSDIVVAYSGGVDSTLLLCVALKELGKKVRPIFIQTELTVPSACEQACVFTAHLGINLSVFRMRVLTHPDIKRNSRQRCYFCKKMMLQRIQQQAKNTMVCDGSNADDMNADRPGNRALAELGVHSPLAEAGLHKLQVRQLARHLKISNWNQPAQSCLATRFPPGTVLGKQGLSRVAKAEKLLQEAGLTEVRARVHGDIVRIEVPLNQTMAALKRITKKSTTKIKSLGFTYVCLDLPGAQRGSR